MIVPSLTGTFLSNSKHLLKQTRHRCGSWKSLFLIKYRCKCKYAHWEFSKSLLFTGCVTEFSCQSKGASYLQKLKYYSHYIEDGVVFQIWQWVTNKIVLPFLPVHKNKKITTRNFNHVYAQKQMKLFNEEDNWEVIRSRIRWNYTLAL